MSQKITTHLWYDKQAKAAAKFYTTAFKGKIKHSSRLEGTPSGSVDVVVIDLMGQQFTLISAGPLFKFNPSISFLVSCDTAKEVDALWKRISKGGTALMELGEYPFAKRYGWIQDKFGLSWQVIVRPKAKQKITPTLLFVGGVCGRAEEAMRFYASVFKKSKVGPIDRYGKGEEPDKEGTVKHGAFTLEGQALAAMDSAHEHKFAFNEAVSLMVSCKDQKEIDYYWNKLSAVPESEQCGWLKDKYGVSWQVTPASMDKMMRSKDKKKLKRVTEAFLQMKKFNLKELERAARGK